LPLDEIAREGARRMLIEALKAEADESLRHRRSMTAAVMNKEVASASPAGSCRVTCAVRPRWPRCGTLISGQKRDHSYSHLLSSA
jgi:hypothetical protein